ncbi:gas vesicle protein [Halogeometricum borinquense]|uniref:Gas vesicle protein n=1 Tax=Halogeometricum borinquense TaxID=60847 RepID=A0A6C0UJL1_9EURY|nr:gas vesicle protein [Halogeometricum borinquense]QIB75682.1 gas vesicle protein [Halogeometricum borinquense]
MSDPKPTRSQGDLAEMLEMLLDKGVVINADIAVSVGDTELLGIQLRAAVASFETAAQYGLEFPTGTDMKRVETAAGVSSESSDANSETQSETELAREATDEHSVVSSPPSREE